jgi:primary-amine oxidase
MIDDPARPVAGLHPLRPLSPDEVDLAGAIVRDGPDFDPSSRFVYVTLVEPHKADVRAVEEGGPVPARLVKVVLRNPRFRATVETVVSIDGRAIISWEVLPYAQTSLTAGEVLAAERAVRADPRWQAAMRRRGLDDLDLAMIDPWPLGHWGQEDDPALGRYVRPLTWVRADAADNGYARPVEGLITRVDLDSLEVVEVSDVDDVPIPAHPGNYSTEALTEPSNVPYFPAGARRDLRPVDIVQPEGPSFELDGHHLCWQKWELRIGFSAREGLVLHQIGYRDGERLRPVIYRASLSEMFVPYGDPAPTHARKMVLDEGEVGIGLLTNTLSLGCDCVGAIAYLDGIVNDETGSARCIPNAICLHEEDAGILWKHSDFRTGYVEVRRSRRMVISSIVTVGNYEYAFYWYLYQDGSLEYQVKLTGVISNGAFRPGDVPTYGTAVAPGVYGPNHQHFFNVRLDMTVDGVDNRLVEVNPTRQAPGPANPAGAAWTAAETVLARESEAQRHVDPLGGRYWKIVNPASLNALGQPVAYKLMPGDNTLPLLDPTSRVLARAGFITKHLWATHYDPAELFATGDYPYQSPGGDGLPAYVAGDRDLLDTDLVVWYTFGLTHVVRPEDWPVMPVAPIGFRLLPVGFFDGNPGLDVPGTAHGQAACEHQSTKADTLAVAAGLGAGGGGADRTTSA